MTGPDQLENGNFRIARDEGYCALPVGGDTYRSCSHGCLYCFDPQMDNQNRRSAKTVTPRDYRQLFNSIYENNEVNRFVTGLKTAVRLGICSDPFPPIEHEYRVTFKALSLLKQAGISTMVTTKAPQRVTDEYLPLIDILKVSFSTFRDELAAVIEPGAPRPSVRLDVMRSLHERGVKIVARLNPFLHTEEAHYDLDLLRGAADAVTIEPLRFSVTWRQTWPIEFWGAVLGEEPPARGCFKRGTPEYKWAQNAERHFFAPLQHPGEPYQSDGYHWVLSDPFKWRSIYARMRDRAHAAGLKFGICSFGAGIHNVDLNDPPCGCLISEVVGYDKWALVPQWHKDRWQSMRMPVIDEIGQDIALLRIIYANAPSLRPIALDGEGHLTLEAENEI